MDGTAVQYRIRARRACATCHRRKVRCIQLIGLENCVHCTKDNLQCHYYASKRREKKTVRDQRSLLQTDPVPNLPQAQEIRQPVQEQLVLWNIEWKSTPEEVLSKWCRAQSIEKICLDHDNNAQEIPSRLFVGTVFRAYLKWHHYMIPVLESSDIASLRRYPETEILLLNAILFVGADHVEMNHLKKEGYESRVQARTVFLAKALQMAYERRFACDTMCWRALILLSFADSSDPTGMVPTLLRDLFMECSAKFGSHPEPLRSGQHERLIRISLVREAEISTRYNLPTAFPEMSVSHISPEAVESVPHITLRSIHILHRLQTERTRFWLLLRTRRCSAKQSLKCMVEWRRVLSNSFSTLSLSSQDTEEECLVILAAFAHNLFDCYLGMLRLIDSIPIFTDSIPTLIRRWIIADIVGLCEKICRRDLVLFLSCDLISRLVNTLVTHTPCGQPAPQLMQGVQLVLELPCVKLIPDMEAQLLISIMRLLRGNQNSTSSQFNAQTPQSVDSDVSVPRVIQSHKIDVGNHFVNQTPHSARSDRIDFAQGPEAVYHPVPSISQSVYDETEADTMRDFIMIESALPVTPDSLGDVAASSESRRQLSDEFGGFEEFVVFE